ncbi:MAG: hypothetical protein ACTSU5_12035 [Promethearchaeota archaeon]
MDRQEIQQGVWFGGIRVKKKVGQVNIDLTSISETVAGATVPVKCRLEFEERQRVFWAGVKLVTQRLCKNELIVAKRDLFGDGEFEAGTYLRNFSLTVAPNIIPSIPARNINYRVVLGVRIPKFRDPDAEVEVVNSKDLLIRPVPVKRGEQEANPVVLAIGGLQVKISKDVFKPGEAIKVDYAAKSGYKSIQVKLIQNAGVTCYCPEFGRECQYTAENPPVVTNTSRKEISSGEGFLLLKVPRVAEPSHEYFWTPKKEAAWGHKFGDVSEWYLEIVGSRGGNQKPVKFTVPIRLLPLKEAPTPKVEDKLFEPVVSSDRAGGLGAILKKQFAVKGVTRDQARNQYSVEVVNKSKKTIEGVSVQATGIQEGLFETPSWTVGFASWAAGEVKSFGYPCRSEVTSIVLNFEDNGGRKTRLTHPTA